MLVCIRASYPTNVERAPSDTLSLLQIRYNTSASWRRSTTTSVRVLSRLPANHQRPNKHDEPEHGDGVGVTACPNKTICHQRRRLLGKLCHQTRAVGLSNPWCLCHPQGQSSRRSSCPHSGQFLHKSHISGVSHSVSVSGEQAYLVDFA